MPRLPYGYTAKLADLPAAPVDRVAGALASHAAHVLPMGAVESQQTTAWHTSIDWLAAAATSLIERHPVAADWNLCLEYEIPRRGGRIDAVLLADDLVFVIEFKSTKVDADARRQAEDYALELFDFHEGSHGRRLFPVACAAKATVALGPLNGDIGVAECSTTPPGQLADTLLALYHEHHDPERSPIHADEWLFAAYHPTPTIIEGARALYAGHAIRELSQSEASAEHLQRTQDAVIEVVRRARETGRRTICFLTGVPGAGKTLAGLNVVHGLEEQSQATFLSGNGPLVKVLQAVLTRDIQQRESIKKSDAHRRATTFVTNVHRWIEEYIDKHPDRAPLEGVVVFDEAQRAWSREHSKRKFDRDFSEPEMMLNVMSRKPASVIVALIGGGQEINTGEAGLSEWGRALSERYDDWDIVISPKMQSGRLQAGTALFANPEDIPHDRLRAHTDLHLAVSQRSYRAEQVSDWVEAVLAGDADEASRLMEHLTHYPIVMTRDLGRARQWLRERTRGLRRCGLLASSGARRLRQDGVSVREQLDPVHWFLNPPEDVRSSNFLELPMTEFDVQGLELDWVCLAWGADLTHDHQSWLAREFKGTRWQTVNSEDRRAYVLNRYRVLLTRAREGVVIWVPSGSDVDPTREPARYQSVRDHLTACGVRSI